MKSPFWKRQQKSQEPNEDQNKNLSPNLLDYKTIDTSGIVSKSKSSIPFFIVLTILVQVLFITIVILNYKINRDIEKASINVEAAKNRILEKSDIYYDSLRLNEKIKKHKEVNSERIVFHSKVDDIYDAIPDRFTVRTIRFDTGTTNIFTSQIEILAPDALSAALLLSSLSKLDGVDRVILESATLNSRSGIFTVLLGVEYL